MVVDATVGRKADSPGADRSRYRAWELIEHLVATCSRHVDAEVHRSPLQQRRPFGIGHQGRQFGTEPARNGTWFCRSFILANKFRPAWFTEQRKQAAVVVSQAKDCCAPAFGPLGRTANP